MSGWFIPVVERRSPQDSGDETLTANGVGPVARMRAAFRLGRCAPSLNDQEGSGATRGQTGGLARLLASFAALVLVAGLAACTPDQGGAAEQYREGDNKGFIGGNGTYEEIAAADRGEALTFTGTGIDGETISSDDVAGEVVVLNFWFAGCAPCRTEAPLLQKLSEETDAAFLGANIFDGPEQARAFEKEFGITYPSLLLVKDADLKLLFAAWTPITSAPTTLVLDKQGRVAFRFLGAVKEPSILRTIVQDLAAETP